MLINEANLQIAIDKIKQKMLEQKPKFNPEELPYHLRAFGDLINLEDTYKKIHAQRTGIDSVHPCYVRFEDVRQPLLLTDVGSDEVIIYGISFPKSDEKSPFEFDRTPLVTIHLKLFCDKSPYVLEADVKGAADSYYEAVFGAESEPFLVHTQYLESKDTINIPTGELIAQLSAHKHRLSDVECSSLVKLVQDSERHISNKEV